ncbi:hypothetical protein F5887DRAFT_990115, partial [Amanita rubescens]
MLFWHVALLFSGLCTSVLAKGLDGYPSDSGTSQSSGAIGNGGYHSDTSQSSASGVPHGYEELQGCWIGIGTKNHPDRKNVGKKISIQGRKIVHSTLSEQIKMDPRVLDDTYWRETSECEGLPKRTTIVDNQIRIRRWASGEYLVRYSAKNDPVWKDAASLWLGGTFKKNKKTAAAV